MFTTTSQLPCGRSSFRVVSSPLGSQLYRATTCSNRASLGQAEACLDAYLAAAGIAAGARRMSRVDVFRMIKRRVKTVGLGEVNCHTFRATGITAYLLNGGTLERAQAIAAHESPRTTKLYDRTADEVTLEDIEKIGI